jgi:hypothetical protein
MDWVVRLIVLGLVAYFVVTWFRGPKPEPVEDAQARQRVRALETDVENLRRRIEYLEARLQ